MKRYEIIGKEKKGKEKKGKKEIRKEKKRTKDEARVFRGARKCLTNNFRVKSRLTYKGRRTKDGERGLTNDSERRTANKG